MAGRTCLTITHDLRAAADADLILLLNESRIVEQGRHEDLLVHSRQYRQLYEVGVSPLPVTSVRTLKTASPLVTVAAVDGDSVVPNGKKQ